MTVSKFSNQGKSINSVEQPNIIRYPVAQSSIPNVTICILLCTVSLVSVLLFSVSLLKTEIPIPVEEITSSSVWQETTQNVNETSRPIEVETTTPIEVESTTSTKVESTVPIEVETITSIEVETTTPIEVIPEQDQNRYHFMSYAPSTVAIGSHLWTVSTKQIQVNITSTDENYSLCKINIEENLEGKISNAPLGDKIVIWSATDRQDIGLFSQIKYTILLLDPFRCTYKTIKNLEDRLPISQVEFSPSVLTNNNGFEIFFPSQTICFPCRFDANADRIQIENQIQTEAGVPILNYHLKTINKLEEHHNYVYAVNYQNRTSVLRLLDRDFKITKQVVLENIVESIVINSGNNTSYVGVYYAEPDSSEFATYKLFDPELNIIFNADMVLSKVYSAKKTDITIDSMGNSYVTLVESMVEDTERSITLLRYNISGQLNLEMSLYSLEDDKKYSIQTVAVDDIKYCFVLHQVHGNEPGTTDITCYNMYF